MGKPGLGGAGELTLTAELGVEGPVKRVVETCAVMLDAALKEVVLQSEEAAGKAFRTEEVAEVRRLVLRVLLGPSSNSLLHFHIDALLTSSNRCVWCRRQVVGKQQLPVYLLSCVAHMTQQRRLGLKQVTINDDQYGASYLTQAQGESFAACECRRMVGLAMLLPL